MASSQASQLPHLTEFQRWNAVKGGSGLAREGGSEFTANLPHLTEFQHWNAVKGGSGLAREGGSEFTANLSD